MIKSKVMDIDTLDGTEYVDPKTGKRILITFESEHDMVIDICQCQEVDHTDCKLLESYHIRL